MTQAERIKQIRSMQDDLSTLQEAHGAAFTAMKEEEHKFIQVLGDLLQECTHKDERGKSTWVGGFMYSECTICGEDDL